MTNREPYPGLRPFLRNETDIFFGRERQIDGMLEQLREHRFLAVTGTSGSGKSSLVKTGLLAALELGYVDSAGGKWCIVDMRPGSRPIETLAHGLLDALELRSTPSDVQLTHAALERGPLSIADFVRRSPGRTSDNLLILVDQFEELFRFTGEQGWNNAEAFVGLLMGSVAQDAVPIYVVLTMRSDWLGDCARFDGLPELINVAQYLTPRMSRGEYRQAIEEPARVFGGQVDPAVTSRLLNDMVGIPDQLCLVQHALLMMWRQAKARNAEKPCITVDDYGAIGGLEGALSRHADQILNEDLPPERQPIAKRIFQRLTGGSGVRSDVRRPTSLDELCAVTGASEEETRAVIEAFRAPGNNFLTPLPHVAIRSDTMIDISHESLIRQWKRLVEWTREEAESGAMYRRLENAARRWQQGRGDLYSLKDLKPALDWREQQAPSEAWAGRYGGNLPATLHFLDESQSAVWRATMLRRSAIVAACVVPLVVAAIAIWATVVSGQKARLDQALADANEAQFRRIIASAEKELEAGKRNRARALALAGAGILAEDGRSPREPLLYTDLLAGTIRPDAREIYVRGGERVRRETVAAFSPDGKRVAWVESESDRLFRALVPLTPPQVTITDALHGGIVRRLSIVNRSVRSLAFAADGRHIAVLATNGEIELLDLESQRHRRISQGKTVEPLWRPKILESLLSPNRMLGGSKIEGVAFAVSPLGTVVVALKENGELGAWRVVADSDHLEPLPVLENTGIKLGSAFDEEEPVAIACTQSSCATFDRARRLRVYEVGSNVRRIAHVEPKQLTKGFVPLSERIGLAVGASHVYLAMGDQLIAYAVNTGERKLEVTSSEKFEESWTLIGSETKRDGIKAALIASDGRGRVATWTATGTRASGSRAEWRTIGRVERGSVLALAPDGARILVSESAEDDSQLNMLKLTHFDVEKRGVCETACGRQTWTSSSEPHIVYAADAGSVTRFDARAREAKSIIPNLRAAVQGALPKPALTTMSETDVRILGLEPDQNGDRVFALVAVPTPAGASASDRANSAVCPSELQNSKPWIVIFDLVKGEAVAAFEIKEGWVCGVPARSEMELAGEEDKSVPQLVLTPWNDEHPRALIWPSSEIGKSRAAVRTERIRVRGSMVMLLNTAGGSIDIRNLSRLPPPGGAAGRSGGQRQEDELKSIGLESSEPIADFGFAGKDQDQVYIAYRRGVVELWDHTANRPVRLRTFNTKMAIRAVKWSPAYGELIVVGGPDGRRAISVARYNAQTGALLFRLSEPRGVDATAALDKGDTLVLAGREYAFLPPVQATAEPNQLIALAEAMTPTVLSGSDLRKEGLVMLEGSGRRIGGPASVVSQCQLPADFSVSAALRPPISGGPMKAAERLTAGEAAAQRAYTKTCTQLFTAAIPEGLRNLLLARLSANFRAGNRTLGSSILTPYRLQRIGDDDPMALIMLAEQEEGWRPQFAKRLYESAIMAGLVAPGYLQILASDLDRATVQEPLRRRLELLAQAGDPMAHGALGLLLEKAETADWMEGALAHYAIATRALRRLEAELGEQQFEPIITQLRSINLMLGVRRASLAQALELRTTMAVLLKSVARAESTPSAVNKANASAQPRALYTLSQMHAAALRPDFVEAVEKGARRLREIAAPDNRDRVDRLAFEARYHLAMRDLPDKIAAVEPAHRKKIRPLVIANLRELPTVAGRNWPFLQPAIDTVLKLSETTPDAGETFERLVDVSRLIGSDPGGYVVETPKVSAALYAALSAAALRLGDQVAAVRLAIGALRAREQDSENRQGFLQALQTVERLLPFGAPLEPYKQQLLALGWGYVDVAWNLHDVLEAREESKKLPAGEIETARRIVDLGHGLHRRSETLFAGDASHLARLASGFTAVGAIDYGERNYAAAVAHFKEAVRIRARLAEAGQDEAQARSDLAHIQYILFQGLRSQGRQTTVSADDAKALQAQALAALRASIENWRKAQALGSKQALSELFKLNSSLPYLYAEAERYQESIVAGNDLFRSLSDTDAAELGPLALKTKADNAIAALPTYFRKYRLSQGPQPAADPCDDQAGDPYDPLLPQRGRVAASLQPDLAITACEDALKREPDNPRFLFQLARANERKARRHDAKAGYQKAADKEYPAAFLALADLLLQGKPSEADREQAANAYLEFFNRALLCCGAEAIRALLAEPASVDRGKLLHAAHDLRAWAADLGSAMAHEDLATAVLNGDSATAHTLWPGIPSGQAQALLHLRLAKKLYDRQQRDADSHHLEPAIKRLMARLPAAAIKAVGASEAAWRPKGWRDAPSWMVPPTAPKNERLEAGATR